MAQKLLTLSHNTLTKIISEKRQTFRLPSAGFYSFLFISTFVFSLLIKPNPAYAAWTDGQAADVVLGQADFTSGTANRGGAVAANTMNVPKSVCVDPSSNKVFVVDTPNYRVLRFSSTDALVNGSSAEGVFGQADFTSSGSGTTASTMNAPDDCVVDSGGRLWVADRNNHRVLRFDNASTKADGANADGVLGQSDFTSGGLGTTASTMYLPYGLYEKSGTLWVVDTLNNRVLRFDSAASKPDGASADGVLGQSDFTSGTANRGGAIAANTMNVPRDVVVDSNGALFVADMLNHRVLRFDNASSKADGADADGVLGQSDFTSGTANRGGAVAANTMNWPRGVAIDGSNGLYVYDNSNSRILIFNNASGKGNGDPADNVLGQTDFTSNGSGTTASTMNLPYRGWFDTNKGRLWVADGSNHRVLSYLNTDLIVSTAPTVTTQAVTSITSTTATGNGNITDLGSPNPTAHGIVWDTSTGPTTALSTKTDAGAASSTGAFTGSITGLSGSTTYYVKAYATNSNGTSYGDEVTFTTGASNQPPVLASIGNKSVTEGSTLSFSISATDADSGDTLSYSASNLPSGASFSSQTFSWSPGYGQAGTYSSLTFTVSDGTATDSETITITVSVAPPPSAPTLSSPANGQAGVALLPTFSWQTAQYTQYSQLQVAADLSFSSVVADVSQLTGTSYTLSTQLANGTTYYWRVVASNPAGQATSSIYGFITLESGMQETQTSSFSMPRATGEQDYRMISVPLYPVNPDAMAVLGDDLGAYNRSKWRLFRYDPAAGQYNEYPDITGFAPGLGYWLITARGGTFDATGTPVDTTQSFAISLPPGWNQIGSPFKFIVDWNGVMVRYGSTEVLLSDAANIWVDNALWEYSGTLGYQLKNQIIPWYGYWVNNRSSDTVQLIIPNKAVIEVGQGAGSREQGARGRFGNWQIKIGAVQGLFVDSENFLGAAGGAKDISEPPVISSQQIRLYFVHIEGASDTHPYATDFRPPGRANEQYDFIVESGDTNSPITLFWSDLPQGYAVSLINLTTGKIINMMEDTSYSFYPKGQGKQYFNIIAAKTGSGENAIWLMNGSTHTGGGLTSQVSDLNWNIAGVGDFNGDGKADILWRNAAAGDVAIWLMNGAAITSDPIVTTVGDLSWQIQDVGDFNGDGKADILWRHAAAGDVAIWFMNGAAISSGPIVTTVSDLNWQIIGAGDFNSDGKADILWRHAATGDVAIWLMNGAAITSGPIVTTISDLSWQIQDVGDFNSDGKADILWRHAVTGDVAIWFMNGAAISSGPIVTTISDLNWQIQDAGDFNSDGKADVLWRHAATGDVAIWFMNGVAITSDPIVATVSDLNWQIKGAGDFNGDGKADILWRN